MTTDKTIEEMNRVIAEFMGLKFRIKDYPNGQQNVNEIDIGGYWATCKYHEDWNQLMPVVEKISNIKFAEYESHQDVHYPRTFGMPAQDGGVMVRFNCAPVWTAPTLIEATFIAVYDFIQHFTTTKQKD